MGTFVDPAIVDYLLPISDYRLCKKNLIVDLEFPPNTFLR